MFLQGSLFGADVPALTGLAVERRPLDERSWIDLAPAWLSGADTLFDHLYRELSWRQRTDVRMYDAVVDEPRLTWWWRADADGREPHPVLGEVRAALGDRYGLSFDSIGCNLYRDGRDSVAWHGDRHRHTVTDPVVAIVSVGARRPFRLRPRGGGASIAFELGHGDLLVMGGACQHDWDHTVPKVRHAEPRISITYRHGQLDPPPADRPRHRGVATT